MRHVAAPRWVVVAACALVAYLVGLAAFLVRSQDQGGDEFRGLVVLAAVIASLFLGLPTVVLTALLFVRRFARAIGATAVVWMALNAFLWSSVQVALAALAATGAIVILGAMVVDRRRADADTQETGSGR